MAMGCTLRRRTGSPIAAQTVDVGPGGMCVRCSRPLATDEVLGFELAPPPPINGRARVLRQQGHDTYAVRFEMLAEPALAGLNALAMSPVR
jgi:PilZ domain